MRVQDAAGNTLLDKSYVRGTASCTLEEKLTWKMSPPDTRGPPPFKKPLQETIEARLSKAAEALGLDVTMDLAAVEAKRKAELELLDGEGKYEQFIEETTAALTDAGKAAQHSAQEEDRNAVAEMEGTIKQALGL